MYLRLVPAALQVLLAGLFLHSLRGGGSLFQDAARWIQPHAPDFIGSYCRKATVAFAILFVVQALALTGLALRVPGDDWALASCALVWLPLAVLGAIEWIVRKVWFRHYGRGPVDRVLSVLMPAERTERGRRSLEYVTRIHRDLGLPPPRNATSGAREVEASERERRLADEEPAQELERIGPAPRDSHRRLADG